MSEYKLLIDGKLVEGADVIDVINPATEQAFAQCPVASESLLNEAVAAAHAAFPAWAAKSLAERAAYLGAAADALEANADALARVLVEEQGKPFDQAMFEVMGSIFTVRAFAGMNLDPVVMREGTNGQVVEHRTPLGVVAAIMPWNFPLLLLANKLAPALLAGNTVIAKPAPTTPLTTLRFGELIHEILPAGVFNIICDRNDLGHKLTSHPNVAKVAFTGSTATGRKVMASAAETVKRVTLELGGNDAAIVLDDVDPVAVARKVFDGAMVNAGQVCMAIKRAYVPEQMYDAFCAELAQLANEAVVDDGFKQGAQIGPVQNRAQYEKVLGFLADAHAHGNVIAGGAALDRPGYFIAPTIVRDIADDAMLVSEEQFGPVLPVLKYKDVEEVIGRANASDYGLAGTVWGKDLDRAIEVAKRIESGTVWVNQYLAIDPAIPVRGSKQSGLGAEFGAAGLHEYTQARIVNAVPL